MTAAQTMRQLHDIETLRLERQARLDAAKTQEERNRLGQFATPTSLATDILAHVRDLLPETVSVRFLDPAFGTGSFYSALMRIFPSDRVALATGFEIDPHYGLEAQRIWKSTALDLRTTDFTRATRPELEEEKYNLIVCNPPYVRHHHIPTKEKHRLLELAHQSSGTQLNGLAGLYCYFMLLCHQWMMEDGLAAWLIPSEFLDVNYGRQIKHYLLDKVTLLRIHRFQAEDVQFNDATVSSVVVWFRNQQPNIDHVVDFTYGGSLSVPTATKQVAVSKLASSQKWTRIVAPKSKSIEKSSGSTSLNVTLGDLFHVKRGIATGANDFFILGKDQIVAYNLPWEFLTPILPSPRYLDTDEVLADEYGNPKLKQQLFLLNCRLPEQTVRVEQPALWQYLEIGKARSIHQRYLATHRTPWYAQESRPAAPLLCTYMGRQIPGRRRPFRFILNRTMATAPNVYLMLYPKPSLAVELTRNPQLLRSIWTALNQLPPQALISEGRVYGGGLHKIEPAELANAPIHEIEQLAPDMSRSLGKQLPLFSL